MEPTNRGARTTALLGVLGLWTLAGCSTGSDSATCPLVAPGSAACGAAGGVGCAPESQRVDLCEPTFSNPTAVTNPLFPIANLHSMVGLGDSDGAPLRVEVTLLPNAFNITWNGRTIATLESQYVAFLDGRIHETALDWYAQADDGSVWYLGEDVFNFEDGELADTDGTWLAGRNGPIAMIMPAQPRVGDVYRPENAPGIVFEEVIVRSTSLTVDGPSGPVAGAIQVEELHMDGTREDKVFAPGYGEFRTGSASGGLEATALAVPTDALPGSPPAELKTIMSGASTVFDAAESGNWAAAASAVDRMLAAWSAYRARGVPAMLGAQMDEAMEALAAAVDERRPAKARQGSIDVARADLDFQLRHRAVSEIDLARFELWARQVLVDAAARDAAGVKGDATTMGYVRDRFAHTLGGTELGRIDAALGDLREAAEAEDFTAAAAAAERLRATVDGIEAAARISCLALAGRTA